MQSLHREKRNCCMLSAVKPIADRIEVRLLESMLDDCPDVAVSIKDLNLHYVAANRAMLRLCGTSSRRQVLGRSTRDFFSEGTASKSERDDRFVLQTGRQLQRKLTLANPRDRAPLWVVHGRYPVFDAAGKICGVAVVTRIPPAPDYRNATYARVADAMSYLTDHYPSPLNPGLLAERVGVSPSQLQRDFVRALGVPPRTYLLQLRIEAALEQLLSDTPIAEVAQACGFGDHSAFATRFRTEIGASPSAYRRFAQQLS